VASFDARAGADLYGTLEADLPGPVSPIEDEVDWRMRPRAAIRATPHAKVIATRWRSFETGTLEVRAQTPSDCHVVGVAMRNTSTRVSVAGCAIHDGAVMAGTLFVTAPTVEAHAVFRGPSDALHLHVPEILIAECTRDIEDHPPHRLGADTALARDPTIERLARTLLGANDIDAPLGQTYVDYIGIAIVARLLGAGQSGNGSERRKMAGLAKWRLKRAIDYVEAHLAEPLSLADVASATGLTRMHFAAQFRAATGLRPHEYMLRRRIERAQEFLLRDKTSVVDIALSVGFQNQSHFTTVFKRFVGQPPQAWRRSVGIQPVS
jgi:AraC-like DNA-binding protein